MKILNETMMKHLSFPDYDVEKMDFSPKNKTLKIYVEGAWLKLEGGHDLGKGILFFDDWQNLSIRAYNTISETWINIDIEKFEPLTLKDICEAKFNDSIVQLAGFAKEGSWTEWNIENPKMHAEFEG